VWFPDWALRRPDAPPDRPVQVVDDHGVVTATTAPEIRPGMRRREAEALCPTVLTLQGDPGAETAAFEPAVRAVEALVPRVEVAVPGLLFVPVAGAVRYYGGERPLAERIAAALDAAVGPGARVGVADGPFAARLAAAGAEDGPRVVEDTAVFLSGCDLSVLGVGDLVETFRWLGLTTLGDLAALPRAAVASRFGSEGLSAHRLAAGEDRDLDPRPIPADIVAEERFDPPLIDVEQAAFAARSLAEALLEALTPVGGIPHRVEVAAVSAGGEERCRTWRSADPFTAKELAARVRWQLGAWVEHGGIPGGVVRLRLVPADLSDRGRQLRLDEDAVTQLEARRALARAQALVGSDGVLSATPQGGRTPNEQVLWRRWDEPAGHPARDPVSPWPGRLPGPSPALVPPEPRSLEIEWDSGFPIRVRLGSRWEPVLSWAGPWRDTGRWWGGEGAADRYQVVTSAGAFLVEIRDGACLVTGVYD
jgi:protein ImuB